MALYQPTYDDVKTGKRVKAEVYWCDFTFKGKRIRESTGQTLKSRAKVYEDTRRDELKNAVSGYVPKVKDKIQDVSEAVEKWIVKRTAGKRDRTKSYIRERCAHLIAHLGRLLVCDVCETVVATYIQTREKEKAVSTSINREVFFLSRVLGVDRKAAWPDIGASTRNREKSGKAITREEQAALLTAARVNKSKYALPFIATALYTGFRASEVRTLRWRQIDFIGGWMRSELSKTAAGEAREVPLLPELARILVDHRAWIGKRLEAAPKPDHYVFPFSSCGRPVDPERSCTNIASAWWQIRADAGVTCRLHDLRHTYASRLLEAGNTEAVVRELIGHVDPTVLRRYTHLQRGAKKAAVLKGFGGADGAEGVTVQESHVKESPKVDSKGAGNGRASKPAKSLVM